MDPPSEFTAESVRDYILSRGGKVTNHELVKHFKLFLTDPVLKDHARAQFKEFVNTLASIKLEDGEKYLVLKKKYRSGLLAEVLSDVGSEYSYVSHSTSSSTPALEEERQKKISVKEQTQKFNRIASESQLLLPKQNNKRRDRADKLPVDDDDSLSTTTFEGVNKEWILISSSCKYMEIVRMLKDNPQAGQTQGQS
ncbi:uncharacterized protein LOC119098217 [Pollicipes pollicipes]|uniref:uncharacterized protein LOC119098217 n=1 Tax=Pollicipes pollicipes TaxID=41117 RepID=UPI00188521BD|nr:uncharacterized protein LOC119098217 [Pollicipes pollicipes]